MLSNVKLLRIRKPRGHKIATQASRQTESVDDAIVNLRADVVRGEMGRKVTFTNDPPWHSLCATKAVIRTEPRHLSSRRLNGHPRRPVLDRLSHLSCSCLRYPGSRGVCKRGNGTRLGECDEDVLQIRGFPQAIIKTTMSTS
jgi:hypothetical protein